MLLDFQIQGKPDSVRRLQVLGEESGFQLALRKFDEQHGSSFAVELANIEEYTTPIELEPNESLYDSTSRPERGLFFIEEGVLVSDCKERVSHLVVASTDISFFFAEN